MKKIILILSVIFLTACGGVEEVRENEKKDAGYITDITLIEQIDTTKSFDDIKSILGEPGSKEFGTNSIIVKYSYHAGKDDCFAKVLVITVDKFSNQVKKIESKSQFE